MLRQRDRKRTVFSVPVLRGRTSLGRIGDQRVLIGRLDLRKAAPDRAQRHGAPHGLLKRIVTAGVEDDEAKLLGRLDGDQDTLQRDGFVEHIVVALELRVHRDHVVDAIDFHAVAGVIDHGNVGIGRAVGEIAQHPPRFQRAEILFRHHHIEAGFLEGIGHQRRIVRGIGEPRHVLIGGIAEHQRHALAGKGRSAGEQQQGGEEDFVKSAQTHDGVSKTTALPPPGPFSRASLVWL